MQGVTGLPVHYGHVQSCPHRDTCSMLNCIISKKLTHTAIQSHALIDML